MLIEIYGVMRRYPFLIFILILLLLLVGFFVQKSVENRKVVELIKKSNYTNGSFTGEITDYKKGSNGPYYVCEYMVDGIIYRALAPVHMVRNLRPRLFSQPFPVIFDSTNHSNGRVLIFPSDFEKYHLAFPDSLHWVRHR
jgi:hypothetical protein